MKCIAAFAVLSCFALPLPAVHAQTSSPGFPVNPLSREELTQQPLESRDFVFVGNRLPSVEWSRTAAYIGSYRPVVRYFDAIHNEVKTAKKLGRYGAVVEIRDGMGVVRDTRFVTLYRAPKMPAIGADGHRPNYWTQYGVSPQQVVAQAKTIEEYNAQTAPSQNRLTLPALLSGMSESRAGDPPVQRFSARERDRRWWYEQKKRLGLSGPYRHLVQTPPGYEAGSKAGQKYPVLLFLHGSGERGDDLERAGVHGPLRYIREGHTLPFIVVVPQCENNDRWLPQRVIDLLNDITRKYRVDTSRVYLTGLSMGGQGTWATATEFPRRFAALLPVCGRTDPQDARRLIGTPIWVFHGDQDKSVPVGQSTDMVAALRAVGADDVYLKIYPGVGHDSWTETYNNPAVYDWLLKQSKP